MIDSTETGYELSASLSVLLARFVFFFEPISPRFVSFWLRGRLKNWKNRGLIEDYRVKTTRIGKFHYRIEVDLDLRSKQADWMLRNALTGTIRRIRG